MEKTSKEHEVIVLNSVFQDSREFFDEMGYKGYEFKSSVGDGVPDGYFSRGEHKIWIEHTQARLNYGEKGSILPGLDGFCKDVQRELLKEGLTGCLCFDISSSTADKYFSSPEFKSEILDTARKVIKTLNNYVDKERNIHVNYCSLNTCTLKRLDDYKGFRVTTSRLHNMEFCRTIPKTVYDKCVYKKAQKYRANKQHRNENWLFIEEPWGYSFHNDLPEESDYFDKIFIVERDGKNGKECYVPRQSATKKSNIVYYG